MKWRFLSAVASMTIPAFCIYVAGCSSNSGAIVTTVNLSSSVGSTLILGQSTTITVVVTGPSNTDVTWGNSQKNYTVCAYTTTTVSSNGTSTTSNVTNCPSDGTLGTVSNEQTTGTATYLAPSTLPDPTKFPGLVLQFWACSVATPVKCNDLTPVTIDSGVSVSITPTTAAVPTNEKQPFIALLANDLKSQGVTWFLTQQTPTGTTTIPSNLNQYNSLTTCTVAGNATGCGSIDANGVYTAPAAVPTTTVPADTSTAPTDCTTPQNLTIVATSVEDPTRFAVGTITVTQNGPIQFNGINPTIAPQGAFLWDIFLNAPGVSSSSMFTLTDSHNGVTQLNSGTGQVKVLFPVTAPTTGTTTGTGACQFTPTTPVPSTGARIRLTSAQLASTGPVTVSISDPQEPVTQCTGNPLPSGCSSAGTFTYNIVPVRPTVVSSSPGDVIQNTSGSASTTNPSLTIDGGYFGTGGQLATAFFGTQGLSGSVNGQGNALSYAKQLAVQFPAGQVNTGLPGLYSLSVSRTTQPVPLVDNPAVGDLAVFPSYLTDPPLVGASPILTGLGTFPSAVDIDPQLGVLVVAETGSAGNSSATPPIPAVPGAVQFYTIGNGSLTALGSPVPVGISPGPSVLPTGISVNRANHTVAVVNYGEQSVTVLPIPGAPVQAPRTDFSIAGVLQGAVNPAPLPYSIGVDPDTNMGVVAYSSTSASSASNLGFLVDLNPNGTSKCLPFSNAPTAPPCAFAQVTLNTGAYPQVAMAPHGHIAFVSPGGSGTLLGVDVTKASTSLGITSLTLAAGIVTVTTSAPQNNNILFPGNAGTVLITGVPTMNSAGNTNFNGVYSAVIVSDTSFTYISPSLSSGTVTITPNADGTSPANVFFSTPNLTFSGVSQTTQGIAINPISRTAALADADATGTSSPQLFVVNSLDESVSSIAFQLGCAFYYVTTPGCQGGPELLGTADVAWQPYSNEIVSYNPGINQVSVSDPVSARRYALACELKANTAAGCIVDPAGEIKNGGPHCVPSTTTTVNLATCVQEYLNQITLQGAGTATISVNNGTTGNLTLFGGLAVDAPTNQAFVVMSGSDQIDIVNLGPCSSSSNSDSPLGNVTAACAFPFNSMKPVEISEVLVPTPATPPPPPGAFGGIPGATVPEGTLTSTTDLAGVQIFGSGFDATSTVRLDGTALPAGNVTLVNSRQLTVTVPANPYLSFPHRFALDVINTGSGVQSNATDFFVVQAVDLSKICPNILDVNGNPVATMPSSVAIADQLVNGPFSPIAVVSNFNCNNVVTVDINPTATVNGQVVQNPNFGAILSSVGVGKNPEGVAISEPLGLAVVANNGDGTASVVNLLTNALAVPSVGTGTNPTGVAINPETGAAIVTNTGSNTISELNLATLFGSSPATSLTPVSIGGLQEPTAVAIDPDRGANNMGLAMVTALQLNNGAAPSAALDPVDIGTATPGLSTIITAGMATAPATGIVFDPTVITGTANPGVFYASSSGGDVITSFNPDSGTTGSVNVGINPTDLAINPQTGAILTTNVAGKTLSIVDTTSSPLKTVQTIGLPGSPQFGVAIDQFTNLAVIVDQGNNRLLIIEVPK